VYDTVRQIPHQRVTTYGHIAKLIGMPRYSRHVGQALKFLPPSTTPPIPWHRVISSSGAISSRGPGTDGAQRQKDALEAEGIEVTEGRTGDFRVNLGRWGWFPTSVGGEDEDGEGEEDAEGEDEEEEGDEEEE
ncbi:DNA binding methylated-DNA--cysteine S-methyltransferase, partial [Pluteus cervinus]